MTRARAHEYEDPLFAAPPLTRMDEMRECSEAFHAKHPEVWKQFEKFALDRIERGYRRYSAKAIMERVRWESDAGAASPQLKVNDHYTAFYARRFAAHYPQHEAFFETRKQKSAARRATGRPEPTRGELA